MHTAYSSYGITIYSDEEHQNYFLWAKTLYLMQSAHPISMVRSCCFSDVITLETSDIFTLLNKMRIILPDNFKGLLVPITAKPLVEIDFVQKRLKENQMAFTSQKLPIFCIEDLKKPSFTHVDIKDVFEDFYSEKMLDELHKEADFIKALTQRSLHTKAP